MARSEIGATRRGTDMRLRGGRLLYAFAVPTVALASLATSVVVARQTGVTATFTGFAIAVAAFAIGQLARIRVRVGAQYVMLGWGEVGVVAAISLLPAVWVPFAVFVGTLVGHGARLRGASACAQARVAVEVSTLTIAGVVAAGAAAAVDSAGSTQPVRLHLDDPETVLPLVAAALAFFLAITLLAAAWSAFAVRDRVSEVWRRTMRAKRLMLAGNVAVGIACAEVIAVNAAWLVLLVPVPWVLRRVYEHQLRASQERVTWAALADATRGLNQLDETGVAEAVLRGAARVFGPLEIEVALLRPQGSRRVYRAIANDILQAHPAQVAFVDMPAASDVTTVDQPDASAGNRVVSRRLAVGDAALGDLRLRFGAAADLTESDQHALSTFADATASAFHDAATHRTLRAMTARTAYDAVHDPLTGLPNRSALLARGNADLSRAGPETPVGLVLIDVDGLRQVNDALGYAAGDEMLQVIARRLRERQIDDELIGRLGGDEFAVLLLGGPVESSGEPCVAYALDRARWLTSELAAPALVGGVTIAVEASAGVVVEAATTCDMAELVRRADVALHQAKGEPSRTFLYEAASDASSKDRLALLADLRDALSTTDQFVLHVQPTVDLGTGAPTGVEALVRWRHPRRGLLQPAEFIGAVEHSDLAGGFTMHVIDMALRLVSGWAGEGIDLPISVNLCARCMLNPELPVLVAGRLAAHGLRPQRLVLEITESVAYTEPGLAEAVVRGLRDLGVQVAVDDFGTGAASLSFLSRFPVNEVKIDRTFVATMVDSPEIAAIVRTTVDLARDLGMRVVAEGVELPEQRAALADLGVTAAQGFLFQEPVPAEEAVKVLRALSQPRIPAARAPVPAPTSAPTPAPASAPASAPTPVAAPDVAEHQAEHQAEHRAEHQDAVDR